MDLKEIDDLIAKIEQEVEQAKEYSLAAMNEAEEAEGQAYEAKGSASSADDECDRAKNSLNELKEAINTLRDTDPSINESAVDRDIRVHRDKVLRTRERYPNWSLQLIAKHHGISIVLVTLILDRAKAKAA